MFALRETRRTATGNKDLRAWELVIGETFDSADGLRVKGRLVGTLYGTDAEIAELKLPICPLEKAQ